MIALTWAIRQSNTNFHVVTNFTGPCPSAMPHQVCLGALRNGLPLPWKIHKYTRSTLQLPQGMCLHFIVWRLKGQLALAVVLAVDVAIVGSCSGLLWLIINAMGYSVHAAQHLSLLAIRVSWVHGWQSAIVEYARLTGYPICWKLINSNFTWA